MVKFRRISFYFILVIIDISSLSTHGAVNNQDPGAICRALAQGTLCNDNTGQAVYPSPGKCQVYYICSGRKLHNARCSGPNAFDARSLTCLTNSNSPLCYPSCEKYTTELPTTYIQPDAITTQTNTVPITITENMSTIKLGVGPPVSTDNTPLMSTAKETKPTVTPKVEPASTVRSNELPIVTKSMLTQSNTAVTHTDVGTTKQTIDMYTSGSSTATDIPGVSDIGGNATAIGTFAVVSEISPTSVMNTTHFDISYATTSEKMKAELTTQKTDGKGTTQKQPLSTLGRPPTITSSPAINHPTPKHNAPMVMVVSSQTPNVTSTSPSIFTPYLSLSTSQSVASASTDTNFNVTKREWTTHSTKSIPTNSTGSTTTEPFLDRTWITPGTRTKQMKPDQTNLTTVASPHIVTFNKTGQTGDVKTLTKNGMVTESVLSTHGNLTVTDDSSDKSGINLLLTSPGSITQTGTNNQASTLFDLPNTTLFVGEQTTYFGVNESMTGSTHSYDLYSNEQTTNASITVNNKTVSSDVNTITPMHSTVSSLVSETSSILYAPGSGTSGESRNTGWFDITVDDLDMFSSTNKSVMHETSTSINLPNIVGMSTAESQTQPPAPCILPIPCEPNVQVGDQDDCVSYFKCSTDGQQWIHKQCTWTGTKYDVVKSACSPSQPTNCQVGCPFTIKMTTKPVPTVQDITTTTSVMNTTHSDIPYTTASEQMKPELTTQKTDGKGTTQKQPHTTLGISTTESQTQPPAPCILPIPCEPNVQVGDQDDCVSYFKCSTDGQQWIHKQCTWIGTKYDVVKSACSPSQPTNCQVGCPFTIKMTTKPVPTDQDITTETLLPSTTIDGTTLAANIQESTHVITTENKVESTVIDTTTAKMTDVTSTVDIAKTTNLIEYGNTTLINNVTEATTSIADAKQSSVATTASKPDTTLLDTTTLKMTEATTVVTSTVDIAQTTNLIEYGNTTFSHNVTEAVTKPGLVMTTSMPPMSTSAAIIQSTNKTLTDTTVESMNSTLLLTTIMIDATTQEQILEKPTSIGTSVRVQPTTDSFIKSTETPTIVMEVGTTRQVTDSQTTTSTSPLTTSEASTIQPVTTAGNDVIQTTEMTTSMQNVVTTQEPIMTTVSMTTQPDMTTEMLNTTSNMTTEMPFQGTTVQPSTVCNRSTNCEPLNLTLPNPDNCNQYFQCISPGKSKMNIWRTKICPQQEHFDSSEMACTNNTNVTCQEPCKPVPDVTPALTPRPSAAPTTPAVGVSTAAVKTPADSVTTAVVQASTPAASPATPKSTPIVGAIPSHSIIVMSQAALEGSDYRLQCIFTVIPTNIAYTVSWFLNKEKLRNSDRIKISQTSSSSSHSSILLFSPLNAMDTGFIECLVQLSTAQESRKEIPLDVIAKPIVDIDLRSITLIKGQELSLTCMATQVSETTVSPSSFEWYRNGLKINETGIENITSGVWTSYLITTPMVDVNYSCAAQNTAGEGEQRSCSVVVLQSGTQYCTDEQKYGVNWTMTVAGKTSIQKCPNDMMGEASRLCVSSAGGAGEWQAANLNHCVDKAFMAVLEKVQRIEEGIGGGEAELSHLTSMLEQITNVSTAIPPGNLNITCESTQKLGRLRLENIEVPLPMEELESMVNTLSNLLAEMNEASWRSINNENPNRSVSVMFTVDAYREAAASQLTAGQTISVSTDNLVLEAECFTKENTKDVSFPQNQGDDKMDWTGGDKIVIQEQTLNSVAGSIDGDSIAVSSSYYKNLERLLPSYFPADKSAYLNSKVLAVSIYGLASGSLLQPPIQLAFTQDQPVPVNYSGNISFWKFEEDMWSTEGCSVVTTNGTYATYECNHLTNFAVLVTRNPVEGIHAYILSIISIVGCVISIGGMFLTILIYVSIWKHVKSHHAVVLLNLCIALIIANLIFITGVDKTEPREACIAIAVLLHYFYLAAFCLMLVEGIQLILYIIYVFHVRRKRETASLIFLGWFLPAVVVAICLGINKTEGYGNEDYCWLDPNTWLFWVFIVPVGIIVVINVIILICVLKRISTSKIHQIDKNRNQKIRSSIWNIVVVMPILGITWLFGIFSVNMDILAFQYIFAISNSLQGLFIFIFHALCNKKALGRRKSGSGSTMVRDTLTASKKGSTPTVSSSGLFAHFLPGKKGRYHVKTPSSVRTQRSRLKSDSSGKSSSKSFFKKGSKDKKKNSLSVSTETPPYDTIPADFMDFEAKPTDGFESKPPMDAFHTDGRFAIENDYMIHNFQRNNSDILTNGGYNNPTFDTFSADPNNVDINLSEADNSTLGRLNFIERLNSVTEMRTEEYMDVKLCTDNVRFRDSPQHTPRSSPFLPRSTPFLAKHSPGVPVKSQTSFNC